MKPNRLTAWIYGLLILFVILLIIEILTQIY
jgi:hypothetical protein